MNSDVIHRYVTSRKRDKLWVDESGSTLKHRVDMVDSVNRKKGVKVFDDCVVTFDDYVCCQQEYADRDGKMYSYKLKEVLFQVKPVKEKELEKIYLELYSDMPISGNVTCRDPSHEWSVYQALNFGYFNQFDKTNFPEKQAVQRLLAGSYVYYISATYPMMKVAGKFKKYMTFRTDGKWIECGMPDEGDKSWFELWEIRLNKLT